MSLLVYMINHPTWFRRGPKCAPIIVAQLFELYRFT